MFIEQVKYWGEKLWYITVCNVSQMALVHFKVLPNKPLPFLWLFVAWLITFFGGDYLISKHDKYLFKRKVKKLAKEVAKFEGIDSNDFDYDNIEVIEDKETGIVEVVIKNKGEDKDDTRI